MNHEQPSTDKRPSAAGQLSNESDARLHEIRGLVSLACDDRMTETQRERMEELVCTDERCRDYYINTMFAHASLPKYCGGHQGDAELFQRLEQIGTILASDDPDSLPDLTAAFAEVAEFSTGECTVLTLPPPRPVPVRRTRLWGVRPSAAIAFSLALMMITAVMASESIRTIITEILLPSRFTLAEGSGGLTSSVKRGQLLSGPNRETGTRRIGSSGNDDVALASMFVFPLPALDDLDQVHSARLEWTLKQKDAAPDFSVDLYGLGYLGAGRYQGRGFWEGPFDESLRTDYGMRGRSDRRVQLIQTGVMSPDTEPGRVRVENRRLVEFLLSLYQDGARAGDLVVFRLNSQESTLTKPRAMGYAVVHPPVVSGLTKPSEFPMLWVTAKRSVRPNDYSIAHESYSTQSMLAHRHSGLVRSRSRYIETGSQTLGVRTIGSSTRDGQSLAVALLFTLPPIEEYEAIEYASLEFTVVSPAGDPRFSADLYGLGFSPSGRYATACFFEGERDEKSAKSYRLSGEPEKPVALIAQGVVRPGDGPGRVVIEGDRLVAFLRGLYSQGAEGGDTVVFRLNADQSTKDLSGATGFRIVLPPAREHVDPRSLPELNVTAL